MKTLRSLLVAFVAVFSMNMSAQAQAFLQDPKYGPDEATRKMVAEKLNMMQDAFSMKNTAAGIKYAREVVEIAPQASRNVYIHLGNAYRLKINLAKTIDEKKMYTDSLIYFLDKRAVSFPEDAVEVLARKAYDYRKFRPLDIDNINKYFKEAILVGGKEVDPNIVVLYFSVLGEGYKADMVITEVLLDEFDRLSSLINDTTEEGVKAKQSLDAVLITSGAASCENLEKMFKPRVESDPKNVSLLKSVAKYMNRERCNTDFRLKVNEQYFALDPQPETALAIASIYEQRKNHAKANEYIKRAIDSETDPARKASLLVQAALSSSAAKNFREAADFSRQAIAINPEYGFAYMTLSQAYIDGSESQCSDFDRQTVLWIVVDNLTKAREKFSGKEANQSAIVEKMIANYRANFPNAEECFFRSLNDGDSYDVKCGWISGRTTVRIRR